MPSKDTISHKANTWMVTEGLVSSDRVKRNVTERAVRGEIASRTERRAMSAQVQRLAKRTGADPDELAKKIPADTLRRTKYPVLEQVDEHGRRIFKHDPMIEEGRKASIRP